VSFIETGTFLWFFLLPQPLQVSLFLSLRRTKGGKKERQKRKTHTKINPSNVITDLLSLM